VPLVSGVQVAEAAHEKTLEAMESFLNLGADEVDIRTIRMNFTLVAELKVRSFFGCLDRKLRSTSPGRRSKTQSGLHPVGTFVPQAGQRPMGCGVIVSGLPRPSPDDIEFSMPEMRERCAQYPT
jgi:hypothetical protein